MGRAGGLGVGPRPRRNRSTHLPQLLFVLVVLAFVQHVLNIYSTPSSGHRVEGAGAAFVRLRWFPNTRESKE